MDLTDSIIFDLLPDGLLAVDAALRVLRVNRAACRLLGLRDAAALSGAPVADILDAAPFERLLSGERTELHDTAALPESALRLERSFFCDGARRVFICLLREGAQQEARERAAALAEAIGERQLRLVHEIAGLLGETAVETQAAVHELRAALLPGGEARHD